MISILQGSVWQTGSCSSGKQHPWQLSWSYLELDNVDECIGPVCDGLCDLLCQPVSTVCLNREEGSHVLDHDRIDLGT